MIMCIMISQEDYIVKFDLRNSYFPEQLCKLVWKKLLMAIICNRKTFKKHKNL